MLVRRIKKYALENFRTSIVNIQGNEMILDSKDGMQLSIHGIHEPTETNKIKNEINSGDVILDIGANIGYYTLMFARLVGKNGQVYAFEPEQYNFNLLKENITLNNYNNVQIEQVAVSNFNGKATLHISKNKTGMHRLHQSVYCENSTEVDVLKIDDYLMKKNIKKIDFIKIDVEGAELDVLQGMINTIIQNKVKLLLEFIPENLVEHMAIPMELLKFLTDHNFEIYAIENGEFYKLNDLNKISNSYMGKNLFCVKIN